MITAIIEDIKEAFTWARNWLYYHRQAVKLRLAINLADIKQRAFNKRYVVMLIETPRGDKLTSINNDEFTMCKRKGWLPRDMTFLELEQVAFYQTPLSSNNKLLKTEREKARDKYIKYLRKLRIKN